MKRTRIFKALAITAALPLLYLADGSHYVSPGISLVREAQAIVGAPATPVSVAGVARRTTRRVVVAESTAVAATAQQQAAAARPAGAPAVGTVVNALPAGCKPEARDGVEYQNCGGVYYRAAFQGNNLVYVVQ
jgi:hypothetical protein